MSKYQGQECTVLRPAAKGDAGYDDGSNDTKPAQAPAQVWVRMADGSERCVKKSDVIG